MNKHYIYLIFKIIFAIALAIPTDLILFFIIPFFWIIPFYGILGKNLYKCYFSCDSLGLCRSNKFFNKNVGD